ncbi:MAG TPA: sigma-54 dependent transcriptional regulator [Vicinamibacterales bacterium]
MHTQELSGLNSSTIPTVPSQPLLLGTSAQMIHLRDDVEAAARSDAKVLIVGETGVGKEIVARLIHELGRRRTREFVTINCAGLPDSLLESELFGHVRGSFTGAYRDKPGLASLANHGTLFLDELGEMSLRMQALLLRFLETGEIQRVGSDRVEGRIDVRVIAATNRNLQERIEGREFREDLYYRLNVLRLVIPPLRERREDIDMLLRHSLTEAARTHGVPEPKLSQAARDVLIAYRWPGNVRELKNVVERLVVRHRSSRDIAPNDLPREVQMTLAQAATPASTLPAAVSRSEALWERMIVGGESFWTVVYPAFIDRDLTRGDLRLLIKAGLQHTQGSYRKLVELFRMPPGDYKRFLAFLNQHDCHLPFHGFRGRNEETDSRSQAV